MADTSGTSPPDLSRWVVVNFDIVNKLHRFNCKFPRRFGIYPKWRLFESELDARREVPKLIWCSICVKGVDESRTDLLDSLTAPYFERLTELDYEEWLAAQDEEWFGDK